MFEFCEELARRILEFYNKLKFCVQGGFLSAPVLVLRECFDFDKSVVFVSDRKPYPSSLSESSLCLAHCISYFELWHFVSEFDFLGRIQYIHSCLNVLSMSGVRLSF